MPDKVSGNKVFYRTLPHLTWAQLGEQIAQMTDEQRAEAVTVQHNGVDATYHASLESRPDGPCYPDGRKLYPFHQLNCEDEVLIPEAEFAHLGISEYAEKIVVSDAKCPDCQMPPRFCTCNWDQS